LTRSPVVLGSTETAEVAAGTLPRTGADTVPLALAAFLMIVTGLVLVRRAERAPAPAEVVIRRPR
jgi:LPXTG-motif cell wall-anchored protein